MLKEGSFINRRYNLLLICNIITYLAYIFSEFIDSLLGGNHLGETALAAIGIIYPLVSLRSFNNNLVTAGSTILYGNKLGEFDTEGAYRVVGQGVIANLLLGLLQAALLFLFKERFLRFFGCTGRLYEYASVYYQYMIVLAILDPFYYFVYSLVLNDNDPAITLTSDLSCIGFNAVLSVFLVDRFGISGLGIATVISYLVGLAICFVHYFKKRNSVHLKWAFNLKEIGQSVVLGLGVSMNFILIAVVGMLMNKYIISCFGSHLLPAYTVVNFVISCFNTFQALRTSGSGFCSVFYGENNPHGIRLLMKNVGKITVLLGLLVGAVFIFLAPWVPSLYGITTPEVYRHAVFACRALGATAIFSGLIEVAYSYYAILGHPGCSIAATVLYTFLFPLTLGLGFAGFMGFDGISLGLAITPAATVLCLSAFLLLFRGKADFPLYLASTDEIAHTLDFAINDSVQMQLNERLAGILDKKQLSLTLSLLEKQFDIIRAHNPARKVLAEVTLLCGPEKMRIIVRDNGIIHDGRQEPLPEQAEADRAYTVTTSYNRNGYIIRS